MTNVEIVKEIYKAVSEGNLQTVLNYLADNVIAYQANSLAYGGQYHGKVGFLQMEAAIFETWNHFQSSPNAFINDGDYVVVLTTMKGESKKTGKILDMPLAEIWKMKDEKVIEIRPFYWDTQATNKLFS